MASSLNQGLYNIHREQLEYLHGVTKYALESDSNSMHWYQRLNDAMTIIVQNPEMLSVWDSEIIPDRAYVMVHALLAEKIVSGELQAPQGMGAAADAVVSS